MPTGDVEEDREQRSASGLRRQVAPQNGRLQETAIAADQSRSLGNKADEMQRQEVGLVDDLVQSVHFRLVEVGPVKEVDHVGNDRERDCPSPSASGRRRALRGAAGAARSGDR